MHSLIKFDDYAAHGVREYWLVDPVNECVEQYSHVSGVYQLVSTITAGPITSLVLDGFTIPVDAIFNRQVKNDALRSFLL